MTAITVMSMPDVKVDQLASTVSAMTGMLVLELHAQVEYVKVVLTLNNVSTTECFL